MILGFPVTHILVFISSQLLLLAFVFGNSCKTAFEAIIFLFIMHPFDVGDRCEVDGIQVCLDIFSTMIQVFITQPQIQTEQSYDVPFVFLILVQMVVEEMNILTTVFLRHDQQKIIYPNSVLATKPIGNFYRSPDMVEDIDFSVHISTPMEKIALIKERIKWYALTTCNCNNFWLWLQLHSVPDTILWNISLKSLN